VPRLSSLSSRRRLMLLSLFFLTILNLRATGGAAYP
jgi:hypothetical protein